MKKGKMFFFAVFFFIPFLLLQIWTGKIYAGSSRFDYYSLKNGLKVFLEENHKSPLINICIAVKAGSRDETKDKNGTAHLLEHLVLAGETGNFSKDELTLIIRNNSFYFNAHTERDLITIELVAPREKVEVAFKLLAEKIFNLKITREGINKEKKVIVKEIRQIKDDPLKRGMRIVMSELFKTHPYELSMAGEIESVKKLTREDVQSFYSEYFFPANCVISIIGDFALNNIREKVKQYFGAFQSINKSLKKFVPVKKKTKYISVNLAMDVEQSHIFVGFLAPGIADPERLPVEFLCEILGRGGNPILLWALRGRRRLAEKLSIYYLSFKYGGAVVIHIITKSKNAKLVINKVLRFLKSDFLPRNPRQCNNLLDIARNKMLFYEGERKEKCRNLSLFTAIYLALYKFDKTSKKYLQKLREIKVSDLRKAAGEYFSGRKHVQVVIYPQKDR